MSRRSDSGNARGSAGLTLARARDGAPRGFCPIAHIIHDAERPKTLRVDGAKRLESGSATTPPPTRSIHAGPAPPGSSEASVTWQLGGVCDPDRLPPHPTPPRTPSTRRTPADAPSGGAGAREKGDGIAPIALFVKAVYVSASLLRAVPGAGQAVGVSIERLGQPDEVVP
jgi:hypothetical protein